MQLSFRSLLPWSVSLALLAGVGFSIPVSAQEAEPKDQSQAPIPLVEGDGFRIEIGSPYDDLDLQVLTEGNITPNQAEIRELIRRGEEYGVFSLALVSDTSGVVKIQADNLLFRTSTEVGSNEMILVPGAITSVTFIATQEGGGEITILNSEDQVIATIPYSVSHTAPVSQSVNFGIGDSGRARLSYSISERPAPGDTDRWNASISAGYRLWDQGGVSNERNEDFFNNADIQFNFGYSW
jgi:hypothetical protein